MRESFKTFIQQHEAAIVDSAFIAGYLLSFIAVTTLILFFGLRYIRRHQKPDDIKIKGFTKQSLLDLLEHFVFMAFFYIGHVMGVKEGLDEKIAPVFTIMPPFLFSLIYIPALLIAFFLCRFIDDKLENNVKLTKAARRFTYWMWKRGDIYVDTESPPVPDIPDSDTSGGAPDSPIHND